jgi:hypothetical protein
MVFRHLYQTNWNIEDSIRAFVIREVRMFSMAWTVVATRSCLLMQPALLPMRGSVVPHSATETIQRHRHLPDSSGQGLCGGRLQTIKIVGMVGEFSAVTSNTVICRDGNDVVSQRVAKGSLYQRNKSN